MNIKYSISNLLVFFCICATALTYIHPGIFAFGMNTFFLDQGKIHIFMIQIFSSNFIHGGILHILMNSLFIFYFGNIVETMLGKRKYIGFFIFIALFNGILLTLFASHHNTIGISGFALALISYYTLELREQKNPEYKGGITAIILNIGIGFAPGISLYGHLFGAIGGGIFYLFNRKYLSKQELGFVKNFKNFMKDKSSVPAKTLEKQ